MMTLVTEDKKQIKAHRNILSASSPVLKDILQINKDMRHPVIYLRGIQHSEMESILQFIYLGEAKFYEERMNEFLTVAKNLDIQELSKGIEDGDSTAVNEDNTNIEKEESSIKEDDVGEPTNQDIDEAADGHFKTYKYKYECQQCDKAYNCGSHLKAHIQTVHEGVKYACNQCDKQFSQQSQAISHVQNKHA